MSTWANTTKNSASLTNITKNVSTIANTTKNSASLTNITKNVSTIANITKNVRKFLLKEDSFFLLLETGDKIVIEPDTGGYAYTNMIKS